MIKAATYLIGGLILSGLSACQVPPSETLQSDKPNVYHCAPLGMNASNLEALKRSKFQGEAITDLNAFALELTDCLKDTRSEIRDSIAYESLTFFLREKKLSGDTVRVLKDRLLEINRDESSDVGQPFAALVLSEVARADRIDPFLTDIERSNFVGEATAYVSGITDYRGYIDGEGWRHGVAHGADWLMQLALNDQVSDPDLYKILDAVKSQIKAGGGHAYIHGEPGRLARPVLYIASRGVLSEDDWTVWLAEVAAPAPMENWGQAFGSERGLAQLNNVRAFFYPLYIQADHSENETVQKLLPGLTDQLQKLP